MWPGHNPSQALTCIARGRILPAERVAECEMRMSYKGPLANMIAAGIALAIGAGAVSARPLTPAERRFHPYFADLPKCDDPSVATFLQYRFEQRESYYWKSGLEIERLVNIRQTALRKTGLDYIPRRYCEAKAILNDGKARAMIYWIGEDVDMTGTDAARSLTQTLTFGLLPSLNTGPPANWGGEWCVVGLDRSLAYGLNCRAARP